MRGHPSSLLVRITDLLYASPFSSIGGTFGIAPSHHIVMENLLSGNPPSEAPTNNSSVGGGNSKNTKWETYDLKPNSYFFPERDLLDGKLTSDATKERLVDEFPDKLHLKRSDFLTLTGLLESDTQFLQESNVVDYSLFLVRGRSPHQTPPTSTTLTTKARQDRDAWRTGIASSDGQWIYKAIILDFFWSKHHLQPKATTGLVEMFNVFGRKGPMSITTDPVEYRGRFLKMVEEMCEVEAE
ncbi:MAG: hypothetical protein Q9227_005470 [Pyrenula ochraceoflavens]